MSFGSKKTMLSVWSSSPPIFFTLVPLASALVMAGRCTTIVSSRIYVINSRSMARFMIGTANSSLPGVSSGWPPRLYMPALLTCLSQWMERHLPFSEHYLLR
ncbi:MAG: hypothetical protein IPN68_15740 [Bacteroidetes bacterium]|nr:hypothetical protein [Bacteroidota bacterium]